MIKRELSESDILLLEENAQLKKNIRALKSENFKLQNKIAFLEAKNVSASNRIKALENIKTPTKSKKGENDALRRLNLFIEKIKTGNE